jgi:hypothetical protein
LGSADRLRGLSTALASFLALGAIGCATRFVIPAATIAYFAFAAITRAWGKEFHEGYLGWYVLIALCFVPSGDAWSVDARWLRPAWRRFRGGAADPPGTTAYSWAVWSCFAAACIPYVQLSLSKLAWGGPLWFEGWSLRNYVLVDNLNLPNEGLGLGLRAYDAPTWMWTAGGFFGLATELVYPVVLVAPRLRRPIAAAVLLLHVGIWLGQNALFLDSMLIPLIFFLPGGWPWRRRKA